MAAYYPLFDDEIKEGPIGSPGIGFKLTDDGNYDMEKKKLKNVDEPVDISDVSTKSYVDSIKNGLKSDIVELQKRSLIHSEHGDFDAKGKIIGNVKDPLNNLNVVNKQFFERNALTLSQTNTILSEEFYDSKGIPLKNLSNPQDKNDAVHKQYVDRKTKINDKKLDNQLMKNMDGLYVECKDFWATIKEDFQTFEHHVLKKVNFNLRSSELLDKNLKLSIDMYMKITIYLQLNTDSLTHNTPFVIELKLNEKILLLGDMMNKNHMFYFVEGKRNDVISLKIALSGSGNKLKSFMHIEKLDFNI
ncbi:hypothetical protein AVEN_140032-1 [Araneus ventricosus]|uniref:Uncharacterized protein n=1 Tax=Araneus ventricosus TaxID=182803 RepID=A0A4Y2PB52_ARAVE|nr:hypothetical protein AVEN_140032-1 [Araneus ventricosus]